MLCWFKYEFRFVKNISLTSIITTSICILLLLL
nr:MAG TPA: hypothetical protein [Bacteriophage sp.]